MGLAGGRADGRGLPRAPCPVPARPQSSGLQHTDDPQDARWLAHLLRLGFLPTGYLSPTAERALRELLRKRSQLVRQKRAVVLRLQSLLARLTGTGFSLRQLPQLTPATLLTRLPLPEHVLAVSRSLTVLRCLQEPRHQVEQTVRPQG